VYRSEAQTAGGKRKKNIRSRKGDKPGRERHREEKENPNKGSDLRPLGDREKFRKKKKVL